MSVYSTDSLEDSNEISPKNQDCLHENLTEYNPKVTADLTCLKLKSSGNVQPAATKKDTGTNETTSGVATDKDTRTAGSRNAIIANRRLADASKRRRPASSRNGKRDVADCFKRNTADNSKQEEDSKWVAGRSSNRLPKAVQPKRGCFSKDNPMPMKSDKKLGDVLAPRIHPARKPRSYLELYRRRFSGPQYCVRSPEGSTLSVCGDSEQEQLSDDDGETRSFPTPRDDQSELSFYRRIIEGSLDPVATAVPVSNGVQRRSHNDANTVSSSSNRTKRDAPDDKSKTLGYRPYTIEEYKTLPIPKLDRSLGPDKVEMQAKREWLMRRRSYGNSVSARNRQRIVLQAHRLKEGDEGDIAEKCFLPPLKDHEVDEKTQFGSTCSTISEDQTSTRRNGSISGGGYTRRYNNHCKLSSARKPKKFLRTSSVSSTVNSYGGAIEDSYLESLRQRHLYEKEMVDRIIN